MKIKNIQKISIKYIKGIEDKTFEFNDLLANKPNILVAPNGFGKSSFTKAFKSLTKNGIKLDSQEDYFENNEQNKEKAELTLTITTKNSKKQKQLQATYNCNGITNYFDVHVINNNIFPKAKGKNFGDFTTTTASLNVPSIILKNTIPEKQEFEYKFNDEKNEFGKNSKILLNLTKYEILNDPKFIINLFGNKKFKNLLKNKNNPVTDWVQHIQELNGNTNEIKNNIDNTKLNRLFNNFFNIVRPKCKSDTDAYIMIYQLYNLGCKHKKDLPKIIKYARYQIFKEEVTPIIESINTTGRDLKPKESNGKLILELPDIRYISNGERDSLAFIAQLLKIKENRNINKPVILIIDEVFDYLDDVNLVVCQYYISNFIEEFKKSNTQIIPIIMTHLDPYYFKGYVFTDQKVHYLNKENTKVNDKKLVGIIEKRKEIEDKTKLDKYFLHFHPEEINLTKELENLNLPEELGNKEQFKQHIQEQFKAYLNDDKEYDPLSVCTFLRISIEKWTYNQLHTSNQQEFLNTHKTNKKLQFAVDKNIHIPQEFFLLGIIYNSGLHIKSSEDWGTPLRSKLNNLFIKNMIKRLNTEYFST